jgi:DNA-binding transcriptional regulator YiaG
MKKRYESDILRSIHEEAEAMFAVDAITEERMREYDRDCLVQEAAALDSAYAGESHTARSQTITPALAKRG